MHLRVSPSAYFRAGLPLNSWEAAESNREGRRARARGGAPWVPEPTLCPSSLWAIVGRVPCPEPPKASRDGRNRIGQQLLAADALPTASFEGGPCQEARSGGNSGSLNGRIVPIVTDVTQRFLPPSQNPISLLLHLACVGAKRTACVRLSAPP